MSGSGRDDDDAANGLKPKPRADSAATPQPGADHAQQPHSQQPQQHHGADAAHQVTKPGAATLVSAGGGIGGLVARPAYNQKLTYQSRESTGPVEPLHGPGETPQVAVTLPLDFERCNPQLIVNQLRSVIEPAQAAAIDAACVAKDMPRARQLLREVLSSIAARVNATGDAVALAPLQQAGRAAHTWEAVKYYVAAAHFLRRLEKTQGMPGTAMSLTAPATQTLTLAPSAVEDAQRGISRKPSAASVEDEQRGISRPPSAASAEDAQRGVSRPVASPAVTPAAPDAPSFFTMGSQVAAAMQRTPAAAPTSTSTTTPTALAPPRSEFQPLPRFDTMPRPAPQPAGFAPLSNVLDTNAQPQAKPTTFAGQAAQSQVAHEARAARGRELLDAVQGWDAAITDHVSHGNVGGEADAVAAGLRKIESLLRADTGALPAATSVAFKSLTRHAQHLAITCGTHGQAVLHSALMAVVTAAGDRGVTLDVLWAAASVALGGGNVSDAELLTQLQQSGRLLAHAQERLAGWRLGAASAWLASAQQRVAGHVAQLQSKTSIKDARIRAHALVQAQTLRDASGEFDAVLAMAMAAGHQQSQGSEHDIFVAAIVAYAEAMANADTDPAPLAAPRALQQRLLLRIAAASAKESRALAAEISDVNRDVLMARGEAIEDRAQAAQRDVQYDRQGSPAAATENASAVFADAQELKFHTQNQAIVAQLGSLADMAADVDSGVASYFGNRFNKTLHDTPAELQRLRGVAVAFGRYYDQMRANIDVQLSPTAPEVTAQRTAARLAAVAIAAEKFQDFIVGTHLTQVFAQAQDTITRGAARAACSALILHSTVMLEISVLTGGLASAAGRSVVALGLPELPALVGVVRTASVGWKLAGFATGVVVEAGLNTAADQVMSAGLGSSGGSVGDGFLSNVAVSLALRPLQGIFQRGGRLLDLEKRAATLWSVRGGALVLKAGVEISLETVAAAAVNYVTMRALHDKARTLSTTTATEWLLQGASIAVGRFIGTRSAQLEARIAQLEQHVAGGQGAAQARAVVCDGAACKTPVEALARFAEYEARLTHEQAMLAHEATLTAGGHGRLRAADVKMLEAGNAAARAEMQGTQAQQAKLRMAGLEADNTAGTLWTVAQGDAPAAMARLKAAGFWVTADASATPGSTVASKPDAAGDAASTTTAPTRWFVDFGGQRVEVRAVDRLSSVRHESVGTEVVQPSPHPERDSNLAVESTQPARVIAADVAVEFKAILGSRYDGLMESARILIADPTIGPLLASHTTEEVAAMIGYTKFEYMQLNTALRSGDAVELRRLKPLIEHTNQGLAKLPNYVGPVYRGAALSAAQIAKYNVGTVVTEPAFTSTSTHSDSKFPGNVEFVIDSKTGTRIDFLSAFGHEKEVLFQSGTQFIVVDVIIFGKTTQITMMEVS